MSRPVVLVTGFDPFGGAASNPSFLVAEALAAQWTGPAALQIALLPTIFAESATRLRQLLAEIRPDLVIALGVAEGRAALTPEVIAINRIDARIADNSGAQPRDVPVVEGGPDGLFSTLPIKAMVAAMRAADVPAALSYSAGTFVCNSTFYALMHAVRDGSRPVRAGFVHLPATPDMMAAQGLPSMSIETMRRGLDAALRASLTAAPAPDIAAGTLA